MTWIADRARHGTRRDLVEPAPTGQRVIRLSPDDEPLRPSPTRAFLGRRGVVPALAVSLVAVLACFQLGTESLWLDEATSFFVARMHGPSLWTYVVNEEPNIGLYYLLLHVWLNLGDRESVVRGLSVAAAVATVPVLYFLAERLFRRAVAVTASVLFGLNAFVIAYAQEARPYALAMLLATACSYAFVRAVQDPSSRRWGLYVAVGTLAVYAHIFAAFVLIAHLCSLPFLGRPHFRVRRLAAAYGAIGVLSLPLLVLVVRRGTERLAWIDRPTLLDVPSAFSDLAGNGGPPLLAAYFLVCCIAMWAIARAWRSEGAGPTTWRFAFVLTWLLVPALLSLAASVVQPVFQSRYLIVSLPAVVLLAAVGLTAVHRRWLRGAMLILLVLLLGRGLLRYYASDKEEWREATASVLANARTGDAIVFNAPYVVQPFGYYVLRTDDGADTAPQAVHPAVRWSEDLPFAGGESIQGALRGGRYPRVWLVLSHDEVDAQTLRDRRTLLDTLERGYSEVSETSFTGIRIILFGPAR